MIRFAVYIIISLLFLSCSSKYQVTMYHYKSSTGADSQVLASDLKFFFKNGNDIHSFLINDKKIGKQLTKIKEKIQLVRNNIEPDDSYYEYAFVFKNDTVYTDYRLEFWRYKNLGTTYRLNSTMDAKIKNLDKN